MSTLLCPCGAKTCKAELWRFLKAQKQDPSARELSFLKRFACCSDENQNRGGEAVWHMFGLTDRKHTIRLVVDGKPGPGSDKTDVVVDGLIVFK